MFGQVVKNIIRKEVLDKGQKCQKLLNQISLIPQSSFCTSKTKQNVNDIIIKSPLPSVDYPEWTIDQYVWNDLNKWSAKTALVRSTNNLS